MHIPEGHTEVTNAYRCEHFGDNWPANPIDWFKLKEGGIFDWDWSHFIPSSDWKWHYGVTPFSSLSTISYTWILFGMIIISLRYLISKKMLSPPSRDVLNKVTIYHNIVLTLMSLYMFICSVISLIVRYKEHRPYGVLCMADCKEKGGIWDYTFFVYYASKYYELFDTVILVLREKPLTLLHIWHHVVVSFMAWTFVEASLAVGMVGVSMNTLIHVIMYAYFAYSASSKNQEQRQGDVNVRRNLLTKANDVLRAIFTSKFIRKNITTGQITQFVIAAAMLVYHALAVLVFEQPCMGNRSAIFCMFFDLSLLYLFGRFYIESYSKKSEKTKKSE